MTYRETRKAVKTRSEPAAETVAHFMTGERWYMRDPLFGNIHPMQWLRGVLATWRLGY